MLSAAGNILTKLGNELFLIHQPHSVNSGNAGYPTIVALKDIGTVDIMYNNLAARRI